MTNNDPLLAPIRAAEHREVAGVQIDTLKAGNGRVKRVVYPPGFKWATDMKKISGTDLCMHAHVGFIAHGAVGIRYADGCELKFVAPQFVVIEPGHEGWVAGNEPAVLIEFDFEGETASRFGLPASHAHH